ncbi:MAG: hypothetical protein DWQ01_03955 [Planctomycetota bacterium]|nr:MAG: hypothetical protein DWQ01_03955 [Planctomycetota bacterium]
MGLSGAWIAILCIAFAQEAAEDLQAETKVVSALETRLQSLVGDFVAVERHKKGEGRGHIRALRLPGDFIGRDYWSEARDRRVYAGTDVLQLQANGEARHWWFGSKGDRAEATGFWDDRQLVLVVRDGDGDPKRRYTYDFQANGTKAFHFQNDHYGRKGYSWFMDADYRRQKVQLPADFLPERDQGDGVFEALAGEFHSSEHGRHLGRNLFDGEWLVLQTAMDHAVVSTGWFGKVTMWLWTEDGEFHRLDGKRRRRVLELKSERDGRVQYRRRLEWLETGGYRVEAWNQHGRRIGPAREYRP